MKPITVRLLQRGGGEIYRGQMDPEGRLVWRVPEGMPAVILAPGAMLIVESEPSEYVEDGDGVGLRVL